MNTMQVRVGNKIELAKNVDVFVAGEILEVRAIRGNDVYLAGPGGSSIVKARQLRTAVKSVTK